jgi:hypothetical protein
MNVQDFDGFSFHRLDHYIGERRKRKFSGATAMAGSTPIWGGLEGTDSLIDNAHGQFRKIRIVLLQITLDVF